jgi:hypothetical protein
LAGLYVLSCGLLRQKSAQGANLEYVQQQYRERTGEIVAQLKRLRVPPRDAPILKGIAALDEEAAERFLVSLAQDKASSAMTLANRLDAAVPELAPIKGDAVLGVLFSLYTLHTTHSWDLKDIVEVISRSTELDLDEKAQGELVKRLLSALALEPIAAFAKAVDVVADQSNILHTTRILTDIRPVFQDDPKASPLGAVVLHKLKLEFLSDGRIRRLYISASEADLRSLRAAIDRALIKSENIRPLLDRVGLSNIDTGEEET